MVREERFMSADHSLNVVTADGITEIAIYDGNLNVVAKGTGNLSQNLPTGLYRIRVRAGSEATERLVTLDKSKTETFDALPFRSAIPLANTEKTHEYHMQAASEVASRPPAKVIGSGARIMIFAREWSPEGNLSAGNPAEGLSLLDSQENLLAEIWKEADVRNLGDASAGWCAEVNPGGYFLRLDLGDANKTVLLRPVYVSAGHQLQIFGLVCEQAAESSANEIKIRRVDLANAAGAISLQPAFDPSDRRTRLSELACSALTQSRGTLTQSLIDELMKEKFECPMLGLFAAHLLLKYRPDDKALFATVTDNLLPILGPDHPDLQALWWQRASQDQIGDGRLHVLPMLSASWSLAVDRSIKTLDVLAFGTFYNKLTRIVPSAPWMTLKDNEWAVSDAAIDDYIKSRAKAHISRADAIAVLKAEALNKQFLSRAYSVVHAVLPKGIASYLPDPAIGASQGDQAATPANAPTMQADEKADLARSLNIPADILDTILKKRGD
jgi:hypothetical protein